MFTTAIIVAAGQGKRMNSRRSKQFLTVNNKPIIVYTIEAFIRHSQVSEVIVVVAQDEMGYMKREILDSYFKQSAIEVKLIVGGKERYDSVFNALQEINPKTNKVLIHDGARPLITEAEITSIISGLDNFDACVLGVKAKDTYKMVDKDNMVVQTLNREYLYSIQTPQGFSKEIICNAYNNGMANPIGITDDAMMVEKILNIPIRVVEGEYTNIKITTPDDLLTMEKVLLIRNGK